MVFNKRSKQRVESGKLQFTAWHSLPVARQMSMLPDVRGATSATERENA
jgi:hypothetical protein